MDHQSEAVDAEDICPSFRRGVGMNGSQLMMTSDCHTHTQCPLMEIRETDSDGGGRGSEGNREEGRLLCQKMWPI